MLPQDLQCQERPTVLHVSRPVDGGVARVVTDLVRARVAAGLRAVAAAPPAVAAAPPGGELPRHAAATGAEVAPWPARRSPGPALPGETGRPARLSALAHAVLPVLTRPQLRRTPGHRCLEHVRAAYDVRHTAAAVPGPYRELLGVPCPESRGRISR
ncbi:hypothetical protein [Streptomyces sp. NPDC054765]